MTKIQWTDQTWNPIVGCEIVSPGCSNCYAMKMAWRLGHNPKTPQYDSLTKKVNGNEVWTGDVRLVERALLQPIKRKKPTMYFVNSMGDLFHENVPDEWIDRVFAVMALCPQHTFQVLTKRPERMRAYLEPSKAGPHRQDLIDDVAADVIASGNFDADDLSYHIPWPLPNVWLGVSVENQTSADERIPQLLATPAALRFISAEPLLGPISLLVPFSGAHVQALKGAMPAVGKLDWVICGGESGPKARPMHPDWARSLRDQCAEAGVPFFFKQWGAWVAHIDRDQDDPDWQRHYGVSTQRRILNLEGGTGFHGDRVHLMKRVEKKYASNRLDGKINEKMPEVKL